MDTLLTLNNDASTPSDTRASAVAAEEELFVQFGHKSLSTQLVAAVVSIVYALVLRNGRFWAYIFAVNQSWFFILVWCTTLAQHGNCRPWILCGVSLALLLTVLIWFRLQLQEKLPLYSGLVFLACIPVFVTGMVCIRSSLQTAHSHHCGAMALNCLDATLRAGVLQLALLTAALVGFGTRSGADLEQIIWLEGSHANEDDSSTTTTMMSVLQQKDHDEAIQGAITGTQAGMASGAVNFFLLQSIVTRHVTKLQLNDIVAGRVLWLEYASMGLQLLVVVAVAATLALTPSAMYKAFFTQLNWKDWGTFRLLFLVGYLPPGILLFLLNVYFSTVFGQPGPTRDFFLQRHDVTTNPSIEERMDHEKEEQRKLQLSVDDLYDKVDRGDTERQSLQDSITDLQGFCQTELAPRTSRLEELLGRIDQQHGNTATTTTMATIRTTTAAPALTRMHRAQVIVS
ncbi:unknown protein [Seminavis robusta]|uniref:Transmembrane protein n=1 Tax=Seminavis robusta TaxID=568900 RepID=A0A9N8F1E3_9STRA|nr:unknown protein [Seminavis robusta]|eukprot:Sro3029_g342470.1 n/a (456) ;mRNA; f:1348-2715